MGCRSFQTEELWTPLICSSGISKDIAAVRTKVVDQPRCRSHFDEIWVYGKGSLCWVCRRVLPAKKPCRGRTMLSRPPAQRGHIRLATLRDLLHAAMQRSWLPAAQNLVSIRWPWRDSLAHAASRRVTMMLHQRRHDPLMPIARAS